jgi:preprotein translocase subunit SecG
MELKETLAFILTILFVVISAAMLFFILLQEGKGGGLSALSGTRAAGVEGVTNPIRRFTAILTVIFFVLAVGLGLLNRPKQAATGDGRPLDGGSGSLMPLKPPEPETKAAIASPVSSAPKTDAVEAPATTPKPETATSATSAPVSAAPKTEPARTGAPPKT